LVELIERINDVACLTWWKEPTCEVDYVVFFVGGKFYMLYVTDLIIGIRSMVNKEDWVPSIDYVKKQCTEVATSLIFEFER
jgi:hypothetical protein